MLEQTSKQKIVCFEFFTNPPYNFFLSISNIFLNLCIFCLSKKQEKIVNKLEEMLFAFFWPFWSYKTTKYPKKPKMSTLTTYITKKRQHNLFEID